MTETTLSPQIDLGSTASNAFGEHYLFAINRNAFQGTDASTVFRTHFGDSLFKKNTFYVIAGTDSGLLYQYIKMQGVPKGSRYLFVELPQVQELLVNMDDPKDELVVSTPDDWQERGITKMDMRDYAIRGRLALIRSMAVVHGNYGEYLPMWRKLREEYEYILQTYKTGIDNREFILRQIENLTENQVPAICLKDSFRGKTAVVLAGGPSLDALLPWVRQHRQDLLVIAVSRISHTLIQAGIQPDICVAVDPYPIILNVSREMLEFQDGTLLVNEYHLCSNLLSSWGGEKAYTGPRYPWTTPLEPENYPPSLGATVTNNAFALAVNAGVTQLILGGADFCFSQTGHTHASGSAEHSLGPRPMLGDQRVETNSGMMADTIHAFLTSARVIDVQAEDAIHRGCKVINPAPGSMRLPHVEHIPLDSIQIEALEKPASEIIADSLPADDSSARTRFYKEVLKELDRVLAELRSIKSLAKEALDHSNKVFEKVEKEARFHSNTKVNSIEKQFKEKYAGTVKLIKNYGLARFVLTLHHHDQSEQDLKENNQVYFQSFVDTAKELIVILQHARSRTLCRLEEEKPNPNVQRLIDQWNEDKQPGRATHWAEHHSDYVSQLPAEERRTLQTFQNSFDDSLEELTQHYLKGIENEAKLEGLNARAQEYFKCQDKVGLQNLLDGLEEHRETKQTPPKGVKERCEAEIARQFIPLLQGYLAELHAETALAIEIYQGVAEGPAQIDALQRLFEIHIKDENVGAALEVLKGLSNISSTYTPMYAELLQATGDVDNAVDIYTEYLLANPDDLNSMMKLGKIYHQYGSDEGVEWAMNYILSKDPDNHTAKAMLSSLNQSQTSNR